MTKEGYLTVSAAAKKASVHRATLQRWVDGGGLPHKNVEGALFVKESDLDAVLKRRRIAQEWRSKPPPKKRNSR